MRALRWGWQQRACGAGWQEIEKKSPKLGKNRVDRIGNRGSITETKELGLERDFKGHKGFGVGCINVCMWVVSGPGMLIGILLLSRRTYERGLYGKSGDKDYEMICSSSGNHEHKLRP